MKYYRIVTIILSVAFACAFACMIFMLLSIKREDNSKFSWGEVINSTKYGITQVFTEEDAGSGIIVSSNNKTSIVTNYHVVKNAITYNQNVSVSFFGDDTLYGAKVLAYLEECDLAMLQVDYVFDKAYVFNFANDYDLTDETLALGYNNGQLASYLGTINITEKLINHYDKNHYVIQTSTGFAPGSSGGALINKDKKILGITTFSNSFNGEFIYSGSGYSINSKIVQAFIERVNKMEIGDSVVKIASGFIIASSGKLRIMLSENLNFVLNCQSNGLFVSDVSQDCVFDIGDKITYINGMQMNTVTDAVAEIIRTFSDTVFL